MLAYQKKNCTKRNTIDKKGRKIIQNQNTKFCKKPNSFSKFILSENKGTMPFKLRCMVQSSHMIPRRIAPQAAQYTFLIHQGEKNQFMVQTLHVSQLLFVVNLGSRSWQNAKMAEDSRWKFDSQII